MLHNMELFFSKMIFCKNRFHVKLKGENSGFIFKSTFTELPLLGSSALVGETVEIN